MSAKNVVVILLGHFLRMQFSYICFIAVIPSLFGILVYNDFTTIITRIYVIRLFK